MPLSSRKTSGGSSDGIAPFLQLPHFTEAIVKKLARKVPENLSKVIDFDFGFDFEMFVESEDTAGAPGYDGNRAARAADSDSWALKQ